MYRIKTNGSLLTVVNSWKEVRRVLSTLCKLSNIEKIEVIKIP